MRLITRRVFASVVCLVLGSVVFVASAWAQGDPAAGTWKLNPAKSRVLAQLALTKTSDPKKVQTMFNTY